MNTQITSKSALSAVVTLCAVTLVAGCAPRNPNEKGDQLMNTTTQNKPAQKAGNYAAVNGINLYYEVHGAGQPLVLLHGGVGTVGTADVNSKRSALAKVAIKQVKLTNIQVSQ